MNENHPASRKLADLKELFEKQGYVADPSILMSVYLSGELERPLLVEGPAGVGKTEIARALSSALQTKLIRLQCYEGLDANSALYEWNYQRQLLRLKMEEGGGKTMEDKEDSIYDPKYLQQRPLLQAILCDKSPVLLIDELDRADDEFESYLLELLAEWQITIPEIGTMKAKNVPRVIITGNRTRNLSEAVRRRCFYLWIDYPSPEKELEIIRGKVPGIDESLARSITDLMVKIRGMKLNKTPGVAESVDWAKTLVVLHQDHVDLELAEKTLGIVLKDHFDVQKVQGSLSTFLEEVGVSQKFFRQTPEDDSSPAGE